MIFNSRLVNVYIVSGATEDCTILFFKLVPSKVRSISLNSIVWPDLLTWVRFGNISLKTLYSSYQFLQVVKILSQYWLLGERFYFMLSQKLISWWISKVSRKHYHIPQFIGINSNKVSLKKSNHDVKQGTNKSLQFSKNLFNQDLLRTGSIAGYAGYSPVFQPRRVNSVCQPNSRRCKSVHVFSDWENPRERFLIL